jgi:predicted nucleic acid-binding protein
VHSTTFATSSVPDQPAGALVVDASALVEALIGSTLGTAVRARMRRQELHGPAHLDAEVLSALGRLHRAGELPADAVTAALIELESAPIVRHPLADLLMGAWRARDRLRLVDALYLELSTKLHAVLLTTDARLARSSATAELVALP